MDAWHAWGHWSIYVLVLSALVHIGFRVAWIVGLRHDARNARPPTTGGSGLDVTPPPADRREASDSV